MLRIKRSVRDKYSTQSSFNIPVEGAEGGVVVTDPMAQLQKDVQFVRGLMIRRMQIYKQGIIGHFAIYVYTLYGVIARQLNANSLIYQLASVCLRCCWIMTSLS